MPYDTWQTIRNNDPKSKAYRFKISTSLNIHKFKRINVRHLNKQWEDQWTIKEFQKWYEFDRYEPV